MTTISFDQFMQTRLIVSSIEEAERVPGTDKLLRLILNDGEGRRQIVAGVAHAYAPEELLGKKIVLVANLQPAVIRGVESNGMLLAADIDGLPKIIFAPPDVPPGTRVR